MSEIENATVVNPKFVSISNENLNISFNYDQSDKQFVEHVIVEIFNGIDVKQFDNMNSFKKYDKVCQLFSKKIGVGIPNFKTLDFKKSQITEKLDLPENLDRKHVIKKLVNELFDNKNEKNKKKDISEDARSVADQNNNTSHNSVQKWLTKNTVSYNKEQKNKDEQKGNTDNENVNYHTTLATNDSHNIDKEENKSHIEQNELKSNDFGVQIFRNKHGSVDIVPYYIEARCQKKDSFLNRMFRSDEDINVNFKQYTFTITSKKVSQIEEKLSNKVSEMNIQPHI